MTMRAIICGGSIGGLFAAAALQKQGFETIVLERSGVPLEGRGAGIVTHPELTAALRAVGASTDDVGVDVYERVAYDLAGERVHAIDFHQVVTSWDRMYQVLRSLVPDGSYLLGHETVGFEETQDGVAAILSDGRRIEGDVLVGADGFRSAIRNQWQPEVQPAYSGYVVWRTVAAEADLPAEIRADIFQTFGFFIPNGTQIIGYPIAGPGNDLRSGHLRYNLVWYSEVPSDQLDDMLTDGTGRNHRISIPPPLIRDEIIERAMEQAGERLPKPFVEIFRRAERPFFTPIYDHQAPVMGLGRVALTGDAACTVRPHLGMGVTKAADDAFALARHLGDAPVPQALEAYSTERTAACRLALEIAQGLGGMIFDVDRTVNQDGRSHADMEEVMRVTAAVPPDLQDPQARNSS